MYVSIRLYQTMGAGWGASIEWPVQHRLCFFLSSTEQDTLLTHPCSKGWVTAISNKTGFIRPNMAPTFPKIWNYIGQSWFQEPSLGPTWSHIGPTQLQHTPKNSITSDVAGFKSLTWAQHGPMQAQHGPNIAQKIAVISDIAGFKSPRWAQHGPIWAPHGSSIPTKWHLYHYI